jgi:hypothetical protein
MITRGLTRVEAPACIDLGLRSIAMSSALCRLASVGPPYRGGGGASSGLEAHSHAVVRVPMLRVGGRMGQGRIVWLHHQRPGAPLA